MNCEVYYENNNNNTKLDASLPVSLMYDCMSKLSNDIILNDCDMTDVTEESAMCNVYDILDDESHSSSNVSDKQSNDLPMLPSCLLSSNVSDKQISSDLPMLPSSIEESSFAIPLPFKSQSPSFAIPFKSLSTSVLSVEESSSNTVPISPGVLPSNNEKYNLIPLQVKCKQSIRDLRKTCEKMGLVFCAADFSINEKALRNDYWMLNCSVEGLYPHENLVQLCNKLKLKFNNGATRMTKRRVDLILDHKFKERTMYYLVKWKRLSSKRNSWIPQEYLLPEYKSLVTYYNVVSHLHTEINQDMINHFYLDLVNRRPYDFLVLTKLCALIFNKSEELVKDLSFSHAQLKEKAKVLLKMPNNKINKIQSELLKLMQFAEERKRVLVNLREWEKDINNFNPATYIEVENNFDLQMAPTNFQFIHDYVRNQEIVEEPICFCNCDNCYENKKSCCSRDSDGEFPYNRYRRLQLLPGYPIYECNKRCKCGDDCINRVVQHGQKVKVAIFRTSNGCGWGLKALETIQKDQFVLEYLGEIITSEEAEARGELYDFIGRTYLFDLDYGEGNCLYTVDAGHMGNAGHFINHSCDPNLHVFAVWINNPDPNLPRLALFSKRKINRGEELTFDYKMVKNRDGFGMASSPPIGVPCKCNSKNCRKYLF